MFFLKSKSLVRGLQTMFENRLKAFSFVLNIWMPKIWNGKDLIGHFINSFIISTNYNRL